METRSLLIASLVGGVVMALLSHLPVISLVNCLACAWLWLSGGFAVWFYLRQERKMSITAGQGAIIGALSGLFGAILGTIVGTIFGGATIAALAAADPSGTLEGALGSALMAGGFSLIGLLFNIFLYPFFGAIGGAAATAILGKSSSVA
jgi:hypothetical protein